MNQIYIVQQTDIDREYTIGYATGHKRDIEKYYSDSKGYGLRIVPISVINVTSELVNRKSELLSRKEKVEQELTEINKEIENASKIS